MNNHVSPSLANELPYRPGVGIVLINEAGLIWIGRRLANLELSNCWQMPQGGLNPLEDPAEAALRELTEETGTGKAEIIARTRDWFQYDVPSETVGIAFGGKYRGQRQLWFAFRFLGSDTDFNIHNPPGGHQPEFDDWRWATSAEVVDLIVGFKRPVYEGVLAEFSSLVR